MGSLVKFFALLAGVIAVARIVKSPTVCVCTGPFCTCNHRPR